MINHGLEHAREEELSLCTPIVEIGYGYIELKKQQKNHLQVKLKNLLRPTEGKNLIKDNRYLWNSEYFYLGFCNFERIRKIST